MDFEKDLTASFTTTFPGLTISVCADHRKRCLRKRIDTDGLMSFYFLYIKMQ
jgi:hypothetical protein